MGRSVGPRYHPTSAGTGPPRPNAPTLDGSAANENDYALADILPVSDADAGTGTATMAPSGLGLASLAGCGFGVFFILLHRASVR